MPITAAQTSVTCRSPNRKLFDEPDLENEKTAEERRKALPFLFNAHNLPFRDRFQEFRQSPGLATVSAYRYFCHFGLARPGCAKHRVCLVRRNCFVNSWPEDLGLQFHFSQRAAHRLSIHIIPIPVI